MLQNGINLERVGEDLNDMLVLIYFPIKGKNNSIKPLILLLLIEHNKYYYSVAINYRTIKLVVESL